MKIKKIIAPTMPIAMEKIKKELGSDAVILNSKEIKSGGIFGLFSKKNVEVIAGVDPSPPNRALSTKPTTDLDHPNQQHEPKQTTYDKVHKQPLDEDIAQFSLATDSQVIRDKKQQLEKQGLSHQLLTQIEREMIKEWYKHDENLTMLEINDIVFQYLNKQMVTKTYGPLHTNMHLVSFVGPTGVGKTTTIAKIASKAVLEEGRSVAFITTDTYRIAAIEQLKTYAELLSSPLKVAYTKEDFKDAVTSFKDQDLVFIDSAGRNYQDSIFIHELTKTIDFTNEMVTYLVLSATSKYEDIASIYKEFSNLPINQLIFTKMDETKTYGSLINLLYEVPVGIAYLTNGQNVPDDIIEGTPETLIKNLVGANDNE